MLEYLISVISILFGNIMRIFYSVFQNYGISIIVFTILTKIILFPLSVLVQKNSIKMVKMKPKIEKLKFEYNNKDEFMDKQIDLFKKEKYHPTIGIIPLLIQIPIIIGLISVICSPLKYLLKINANDINEMSNIMLLSKENIELEIIRNIKLSNFEYDLSKISNDVLCKIKKLNMEFIFFDLSQIPKINQMSIDLLIPILSGITTLLLCIYQNKKNVLQMEQSMTSKCLMTIFMIVFSVYFAFQVPIGVGVYWILGNIISIFNLFVLNMIINPKEFIDYEALKKIKKISLERERIRRNNLSREKRDYKSFFKQGEVELVFYSEKSGFYKYYKAIIEEILKNSKIRIHYVTSDPNDKIFEMDNKYLNAYYINSSSKLISFFMNVDTKVFIMTMPDLGRYYLKKSLINRNTEYIYIFHYPLSTHMVLKKGALNNYDTIFCIGEFQFQEIRKNEKIYGKKEKKMVNVGYGLIEELYANYISLPINRNQKLKILIAPSWQKDNILDSCIDELMDSIINNKYDIHIRPHPEYIKRYPYNMDVIVEKYKNNKNVIFELDFSDNNSIFNSDIVITDWSGIAYEFAFVTGKPVIFINTPPKINNKEYEKIGIEPLEISLRDKIGISIDVEKIDSISAKVDELLLQKDDWKEKIYSIRDRYIGNFGTSGKVGADYIINKLRGEK